MNTLAVILARAGSKGLPDKCVLPLAGRPVIAYTIAHAQQSRYVTDIVLTTDSPRARSLAHAAGIDVIDRPAELAADTARVDDAVRHAVQQYEAEDGGRVDVVVILYGNVPVRGEGIIDRCVNHLIEARCDSVRTLTPAGKHHPDWAHKLDDDRMIQHRVNSIHRRQELEPVYFHDSAVIVVTRDALFAAAGQDDPHRFFGADRRGVVQNPEDTVDIDTRADFYLAEAILRMRSEQNTIDRPTGASRRPAFTAAIAVGG
jgi:CMP-N-acetylneuraminic acid synthetase